MRKALRFPTILAAGLGLLVAAWEGRAVHAEPSADQSPVVAKVGTQVITAADVSRRMAGIPPFQLKAFGSTPDEIRHNFVERVLVREALLAQGAATTEIMSRVEIKDKMRAVMRNAMLAKLRAEAATAAPVTLDDVKAYYDRNSARYHSPPRVSIWQIVVAKREEAAEILAHVKKDSSVATWKKLARERSLDKVTNMRDGDLGFVTPDGSTKEPGVKVDRAILEAVAGVKDAELVPEPVKVGDQWAVVWRRQAMKGIDRAIEVEAASIRQILVHERADARIREMIAGLRKAHLTEHEPATIDELEVTATGELAPQRRPGTVAARRPVSPIPVPGSGGLR